MVEPNRDARSNDMTTWRAGCGGSRTSGSEGGPGKPATERLNRAPRPDPYTHIRTFSGWVYAAFVMDMYSRRIVGWQVSTSLHTTLALDALEMGLWNRDRIDQPSGSGSETADLIHHSDRGVQYRAVRYTERLEDAEVVASVGSKGDSYDNAAAEAFNSTFKSELIRNPSRPRRERALAQHRRRRDRRRRMGRLVQHHPAARQPERRSTHRVRDQLLR